MFAMPPPQFRDLDREEIDALLARHHVGRLAFTFRGRVDVEPIHYVFDNSWIYGRTSPGTKLRTIAHNRWVAFEVDEVDGPFDWRSVVVRGAVYVLSADGSGFELESYERAVELLRKLMPGTLTADDPVPHRTVVFGIKIDEATGRAAIPGEFTRRRRADRPPGEK